MDSLALNSASNLHEFLKWVSERNLHVPRTELEFMLGISAIEPDEEDEWDDEEFWR